MGCLTVNTGLIIQGPPIGTNTTGQEAEGPHCVGWRTLMLQLSDQVVLADVQKAIGYTAVVLLLLAFVVAILVNMRRGRAEVGAEIELAANRKPGTPDEILETKKLDRTLGFGLVLLCVIAVALPALLAGRARPPGRRGAGLRGDLHRAGRGDLRRRGPVRELPRPRGRGRCGQLHHHRPLHRRLRRPGAVAGPGAQHADVPLHARAGAASS